MYKQTTMYKRIIRPLFFLIDPEQVHHFTFFILKFITKIPGVSLLLKKKYQVTNAKLERTVFGLTFKNPVGLAAGFDKNAQLYNELENFGFGFIEIGTVTPRAQKGNPKKRLFRLKSDKAIINRMGFNNKGVVEIVKNLKNRNKHIIIGGNIGKNTDSLAEDYTNDYVSCFKALHPYVDYFVLNISCPNVGSMEKLQDKSYLLELIKAIKNENKTATTSKPILIKISPDLNQIQLDEIIELVLETKIDGVIATNTSVSRETLRTASKELSKIGQGGLSGFPIKDKSTAVIRYLATKSNKAFPIIGVGGIHSPKDAIDKLDAGADLVQIFTGFIYEGPSLVKRINNAILEKNEL